MKDCKNCEEKDREIERLIELLKAEPNVCKKCGYFKGFLADCTQCRALSKLIQTKECDCFICLHPDRKNEGGLMPNGDICEYCYREKRSRFNCIKCKDGRIELPVSVENVVLCMTRVINSEIAGGKFMMYDGSRLEVRK